MSTTYQKLVKLSNDSPMTQKVGLMLSTMKREQLVYFDRWLELAGQCQDAKIANAKKAGLP